MKKIFSFKEFSKSGVSEAVNPASLRGAWSPEELGTYTGANEDDPIEPIDSEEGQMSLKREEFDVIMKPKEGGTGGFPPPPGTEKIITKGVVPPPGWKPSPGQIQPGPKQPQKGGQPKPGPGGQPKPGPGGQPKPGGKPGGKPGKDGEPAPELPKVGDKVILPSGRETTIKKVYPNGDIEV